jgi:hypothetical protein
MLASTMTAVFIIPALFVMVKTLSQGEPVITPGSSPQSVYGD